MRRAAPADGAFSRPFLIGRTCGRPEQRPAVDLALRPLLGRFSAGEAASCPIDVRILAAADEQGQAMCRRDGADAGQRPAPDLGREDESSACAAANPQRSGVLMGRGDADHYQGAAASVGVTQLLPSSARFERITITGGGAHR